MPSVSCASRLASTTAYCVRGYLRGIFMRKITIILALAWLAACSTTQIYDNRPVGVATTATANGVVQVLYSFRHDHTRS